ncbi:MAG: (Fe-S)-binding protein [Candidatus Bathyarchaeota archaeon]|nr:(Fe-S)-binding protein [Candidatus Bathyarchaeota archaeon]MDH5786839.1 (Fe-S)-binding protein [Candidatus Bathyarchaeota archaeon]
MSMRQVIQRLNLIVRPEQILTDPEDLYVYSFEKIFEKQNPVPDVVVKTLSSKETQKILELSKKEGFTVVKRGEMIKRQNLNRPLVLLDDAPAPKLKRNPIKSDEITEILKEIRAKGQGSPRNLALAIKTLFLEKKFDKCKECKICSGYCTVSLSLKEVETWSSKGRALIIRALQNGELLTSKKVIDILYTCTECGSCFAQCFEDLELNEAILATRHQLAEKGLVPEVFRETSRNILEIGDPGAFSVERRLSWIKGTSFQPLPKKAEVLYWVGCMVADRTPKTAMAFLKILQHANVDFTTLMEREGCCGYVLLAAGLWKEAKKVANEAASKIEESGIQTLVTPCAGCYYTFTRLYEEVLDVSLPCEILHSSHFIENLIKNGNLHLKSLNFKVSYHDPCSLGKHSGVFDIPRNVLKAIPDLTLIEMPLNSQLARCCGGGGGLWSFNHQVSITSAYLRLKDLQPLKVDALATACPLCQMNFRYASVKKSVPLKFFDIVEIVELALR